MPRRSGRLGRATLRAAARIAGHTLLRQPRAVTVPEPVARLAATAEAALGDDALRSMVEALVGPRDRVHAPEAMSEAEDTIAAALGEPGFEVTRQAFTEKQVEGYGDGGRGDRVVFPALNGVNVIARKPGEGGPGAVVVLAHYDTVRDSPGADDNTASVVALIQLAQILAPCRFRDSVVLVATDLEERGYFGARRLVRELARQYRSPAAINLECVAYTCTDPGSQRVAAGLGLLYPDQVGRLRREGLRGDFTSVLYNQRARGIAATLAGTLDKFDSVPPLLMREPTGLPVIGPLLRAKVPGLRQFTRSDHVAFWEEGLPAVQITDTADLRSPHYHQPTDTPDRLDYGRLRGVILAAASAVAMAAGYESPD